MVRHEIDIDIETVLYLVDNNKLENAEAKAILIKKFEKEQLVEYILMQDSKIEDDEEELDIYGEE